MVDTDFRYTTTIAPIATIVLNAIRRRQIIHPRELFVFEAEATIRYMRAVQHCECYSFFVVVVSLVFTYRTCR